MDFETLEALMPVLASEYKIVVALTFFGNKAWIRLSANVYNDEGDYVKLRERLGKALGIL